jgi:hypothetical protein
MFVVSDFIAPPFTEELRRLAARHDVVCVALRDRLDTELPAAGLVALKDPESGQTVVLDTSSARVKRALADSQRLRIEDLSHAVTRVGGALIEVDADPVGPLARLMQRRSSQRR